MNRLFHVLNIFLFTLGITLFVFGSPVICRASDFVPYVDCGSSSVTSFCKDPSTFPFGQPFNYSASSSSYSCYYTFTSGSELYVRFLAFNVGSRPSVSSLNNGNYFYDVSDPYTYIYHGVSYLVYLCYYDYHVPDVYYDSVFNGCFVNKDMSDFSNRASIANFFLFGDGDLDYDLPAQDIEDPDLDIVGLSCYILNDQTGSLDYKETLRNSFYGFTQYIFNNLSGGIFSDSFLPPLIDESALTGSIVNYVPGVALSWVSPPLDSDIIYSVWIDGKSTVNYKTSADPIVNFVSDLRPATSVSYAKLKINESSLSQSGNSFYQYNTNQGFETIFNYIENNASITPPSTPWQRYSYIGLDTKISRVYIQASKVVSGNNYIGALSYVDIIDGIPSIHEGVTNIDDVPVSDPDTGIGNDVGVPYTVSGDTIYTGDTIYNGDIYNIYGGSGLVVGGGNPLNTIKSLFNAIVRLVEALYLTKLIKWILLGFTGNPLGDFIL